MPYYTFTVKGNPLPLARWCQRLSHAYLPRRIKAWEDLVSQTAREAGVPCAEGLVSMSLYFHRKDRKKCDIDNLARAIIDALEGIAYKNDSQIRLLHLEKGWYPNEPSCIVELGLKMEKGE